MSDAIRPLDIQSPLQMFQLLGVTACELVAWRISEHDEIYGHALGVVAQTVLLASVRHPEWARAMAEYLDYESAVGMETLGTHRPYSVRVLSGLAEEALTLADAVLATLIWAGGGGDREWAERLSLSFSNPGAEAAGDALVRLFKVPERAVPNG